ncbi:class I SAM-dependent methyltransferase [Acidithiobacillus albertensis]|uniref:class I SAM-dependent methyltransferase n=1 Tax=Acidithiobacillus albertensis TaxID=119978 RepID=UPI00094AC174|nr:class I SAM-dependent methyltransferase [Acidithiobacillus albertensis]
MDIKDKNEIEIEFWKKSKNESCELEKLSLNNIINKVSEAEILIDCIKKYSSPCDGANVLELGGGQGWGSCVYKRIYDGVTITTTDISKYAVSELPKWEKLFDVKVDKSYSCKSYSTNEKDESIDFLFTFAAAHHFLEHRKTIEELSRILKKGGRAIYYYEPTTPRYLYKLAYWRVNRKRPEVPEDVLIVSELDSLSKKYGLEFKCEYYPSTIRRGRFEKVYYTVLNFFPFLQKVLPCTANIIFYKTL